MLKKIALAIALVSSVATAQNVATTTTIDPGQIYNTNNIVVPTTTTTGSTWVNGVYQDQLTCWAWGNPGYCGPNAIVRPDGNINFSFGMTDLYQVRAIADVLPNSGTGLRVNGYMFGFTAKNGNGWDGGGLDTLSAYVTFYGNDGKTVRNDYYNLNYQFNWTTFNLGKTFDTPYATKDLSTVRYGFVGADTSNYWAGPYGPEINNVNFSLKYSVDPCATDVLSSPTCPGYLEALTKITATPTTTAVADTVSSTSTTPSGTVTIETVASPTSPTVTVSSSPATVSSTTAVTAQSSSNNKESNTSSSNVSIGLSVVAKNQQREQSIAAQAVQTATSTAASAAAASQQEAATVAAQAVANSTSSAATMGSAQQLSVGTGIRVNSSSQVISVTNLAPVTQAPVTASTISGPMTNTVRQSESSQTAAVDSVIATPNNMLLDRTNPLNQIINAVPTIPNTNTTAPGAVAVNRNADNNEAAGNVDLTKMATMPSGYNSYLNLALRDAAFYAPREVYRNQRNVDNARAFRQLASDRVHQEMIEQQYRR